MEIYIAYYADIEKVRSVRSDIRSALLKVPAKKLKLTTRIFRIKEILPFYNYHNGVEVPTIDVEQKDLPLLLTVNFHGALSIFKRGKYVPEKIYPIPFKFTLTELVRAIQITSEKTLGNVVLKTRPL
jgi:hypothetical protein